jgi:ATP-binding cassette subfamily E protein 1
MYLHPQFNTDVMKPLRMEMLLDQEVKNLSGGELQRVAITLALGTPADVYLIDEPSAYLDSEQRIIAAKVGLLFRIVCGVSQSCQVLERSQ